MYFLTTGVAFLTHLGVLANLELINIYAF